VCVSERERKRERAGEREGTRSRSARVRRASKRCWNLSGCHLRREGGVNKVTTFDSEVNRATTSDVCRIEFVGVPSARETVFI
jgi:hypothetical protein